MKSDKPNIVFIVGDNVGCGADAGSPVWNKYKPP